MFFLSCVCNAFVSVCLYVPCDHLLGKGCRLSIKMIQARARCRLVCSLPAYCVKLFELSRKAKPTCVKYMQHGMQCSILGICGVNYHIYKAFIIIIQTYISKCLSEIIS